MQKIQASAAGMRRLIRNRQAEIFVFIVVFAFVLGNIIAITRNNLPEWDESVYIGMGKYIFSLGMAGAWESLRPLPLPLLIGLFWKAGINPIYAGKALGMLFAVINIVFAYKIGKELSGKKAGMAAAFVLAITPVFFRWAGYGMTEMPAASCILIAVYLIITGRGIFWAGMLAGLAFLFKFPAGLFFVILLLSAAITYAFMDRKSGLKKSILLLAAGFSMLVIPFLIFNLAMYGGEANPFAAMLRPVLIAAKEQSNPFNPGGWLFYIRELLATAPLLVLSPLGAFFLLKKRKYSLPTILLPLYAIAGLIYFSAISNKDIRFAILFLPFLAVLAGIGAAHIVRVKKIGYAFMLVGIVLAARASYYDIAKSNKFQVQDASLKEFYSYFDDYAGEGRIITNLPYPLAYLDSRFRLVFYVSEEPEELLEGVSAVLHMPSAVKCREEDEKCSDRKERLMAKIMENGRLALAKEIYGEKAEIYLMD